MRWVFILFLLANVIYFGWELDRQIKIDRSNYNQPESRPEGLQELTLLSESRTRPQEYLPDEIQDDVENAEDEPESIFAFSDNQLVTELPDISTLNLDTGSERTFCYTFGPIEEEILAVGVSDWFNSRRANTDIRYTDERGKQLFWIYLAPHESNADAVTIINDLKNKGISDYRLINKGSLRNAISLGLYSSQASVNERLGELSDKGYKPVVVPYNDGKLVYWVDVQLNVEPKSLETVFKGYPSRYNYVPVDCNKIALVNRVP